MTNLKKTIIDSGIRERPFNLQGGGRGGFIMSFKQGHVSIPKRSIFLPLFLFCAYDSSVLQNFMIFTHRDEIIKKFY
jgi:hypothetical protein